MGQCKKKLMPHEGRDDVVRGVPFAESTGCMWFMDAPHPPATKPRPLARGQKPTTEWLAAQAHYEMCKEVYARYVERMHTQDSLVCGLPVASGSFAYCERHLSRVCTPVVRRKKL